MFEWIFEEAPVNVIRRLNGRHSRVWIVRLPAGGALCAVKEYRDAARADAMVRAERAVLGRLEPLFAGSSDFGIPKTVSAARDSAYLVTEFDAGEELSAAIRTSRFNQNGERVRAHMVRIGRWLAFFQDATDTGGAVPFDAAAWRRDADRLMDGCPGFKAREAFARATAPLLADATLRTVRHRVTGVHGDFAPWNVRVAPGRVWVGDFFGFHEGDPAEDAGLFLVCLEEMKSDLFETSARIESWQRAFVDGFGAGRVPAPLLALARLKAALTLLVWRLKAVEGNPVYRLRHARRIARLRKLIEGGAA